MEPTIPTYSIIVTHAVEPSEIEEGDVISYFSKDPALNGAVNTHRVVDIYEEEGTVFYQTRGDANNADDLYPPTADDIIGKVVFSSYFIGAIVKINQNEILFGCYSTFYQIDLKTMKCISKKEDLHNTIITGMINLNNRYILSTTNQIIQIWKC